MSSNTKRTATILLVQNSQTRGNGTMSFLEESGYDVMWAGSGNSALSAVKQRHVDVILLDVALPEREGRDLCKRFRLHEEMNSLPIILLAGRGCSPEQFAEVAEGPDDYLAKPCTGNELTARITAVLKTRGLRDEPEQKKRRLAETLAQAETLAIVDPTTGLFSRQQFVAMFSKEFKRTVRFKQQMSCMLIDLNGRAMGRVADESLVKAIIRLVQRTIREVDTAAWWTGERFIVLLPNTIRNDAVHAAARVLDTVANHPFTWPDSTKVAMSIGVAGLPDRAITSEQKMIEAADAALKRAQELMLPVKDRVPVKSGQQR